MTAGHCEASRESAGLGQGLGKNTQKTAAAMATKATCSRINIKDSANTLDYSCTYPSLLPSGIAISFSMPALTTRVGPSSGETKCCCCRCWWTNTRRGYIVCVILLLLTRCLNNGGELLHDHILSQTEMSGPSRAPLRLYCRSPSEQQNPRQLGLT